LNIYSRLENPAFSIESIRLSIRELVSMCSRPCSQDERWFPCEVGNWVILSDGTFGKVSFQSHEFVHLLLRGGSLQTFPTLSFLDLAPHCLSPAFRVRVVFGIDYGHQSISTTKIPVLMEKKIRGDLINAGFEKDLLSLEVQFKEAGASSLDLMILADFSETAAEFYRRLHRLIQRFSVNACNEYGWVIPFTQLTLHMADPADS